jgi:hypothetical protein
MDSQQSPSATPPAPKPGSRLPTILGFSAVLALIAGLWFLNRYLAGRYLANRYPDGSPIHYVVAGLIVAVGLVIAIFIASLVDKYQT